jgi:hypothetical protein
MSRGGKRDNAGRKSGWINLETKLIRIPVKIEADLMAIAKKLDQGETFDLETKSNQIEIETVTESNLDSVTVSIKEIVYRYKDEYLKTTPENTRWTQAKKLLIDLELVLYGETSLESITKSKLKKKETVTESNSIQNDSVTVSTNDSIELIETVTESNPLQTELIELIPFVLEPLNQNKLAKRLGVDHKAVGRKKQILAEWSKTKDPDGIAWEYREDTKLCHPLN